MPSLHPFSNDFYTCVHNRHSVYSPIIVSDKIALVKELVGKVKNKSADLDWKVDDLQQAVSNFKCGFDTLKEDMTVLESGKSQLLNLETETSSQLEQHIDETPTHLDDLLTTVQDKKETVNTIKEIAHPCGGPGWETVVYLDFRDLNTPCPNGTIKTGYPGKTHTCGYTFSALNDDDIAISYPVDREYTSVCGRIKAYESRKGYAFFLHHVIGYNLNQPYMTGLSVTHGGDLGNSTETIVHIWSFTTGYYPSDIRCPCDNNGVASPPFVGEDYFCERGVTVSSTESNPRNPLWDGAVCEDGDGNDCCSRIKHPYFIKHLLTPTTNNIDLRFLFAVCNNRVVCQVR